MTGRRILATAALPALVCLSLTGCQFTDSTSSSTGTQAPSTVTGAPPESPGPTVVTSPAKGSTKDTKKSFALVVPTGWKKTTKKHKDTVLFLQAPDASNGFYSTFNVIRQQPQPMPDLDDILKQAKISIRQQGAKVHNVQGRDIGGEPAKGYSITRTANGQKIVQTQYFVIHDEAVYTTTMTADADAAGKADQTQEAILSTWSWTTP